MWDVTCPGGTSCQLVLGTLQGLLVPIILPEETDFDNVLHLCGKHGPICLNSNESTPYCLDAFLRSS